jgi:hypothetical protein
MKRLAVSDLQEKEAEETEQKIVNEGVSESKPSKQMKTLNSCRVQDVEEECPLSLRPDLEHGT